MKSLGHVKSMSLNITSPMPFKELEMSFNEVTLMTGKNGTGKTFINVLVYAMTSIMNYKLFDDKIDMKLVCDEIFANCFDGIIIGEIMFNYSSDATINITTNEEGKCTFIEFNNIKDLEPTKVVYMSSQFRLFSNIRNYLLLRYHSPGTSEEKITRMTKLFKLYDVTTLESLINHMPYEFDESMIKNLRTMTEDDSSLISIRSIDVDLEECDFIITYEDKSIKRATELGAGHQSILNMCLTTNINKK